MHRQETEAYSAALQQELRNIMSYWEEFTPDREYGGFRGRIPENGPPDPFAPKGAVLHARILWSFSAAYLQEPRAAYLEMADRAYRYIRTYFTDQEYGGVYWTVSYTGAPEETKKQVYAQAFVIYAFSEYFRASGLEAAREAAIDLYHILAAHSFDVLKGGYAEAFSREWGGLSDLRLSEKDANEKKTMNTHLHVLEAFTGLYRIWPAEMLRSSLTGLLENFRDHIVNQDTGHLVLFFSENWQPRSAMISYGHDIEASWLLQEAARAIADAGWISFTAKLALQLAAASLEGIAADGGMWYEYDPEQQHLVKEKHWWVQAEAMVGFFNAWQLSGQQQYLEQSMRSWNYVQEFLLDRAGGEWFWGRRGDGTLMPGEDKAGLWKCPYHNSRACLEIISRMQQLSALS